MTLQEALLRLAQDHVPSTFGMKSRQEIVSMSVLDDLCVIKCDLPEVLISVEENYNFIYPPYLKTIKIENCDKLKTMVAGRDKREDVINLFTELKSLHLKEVPDLESFYSFGSNESRDKQQSMVGNELFGIFFLKHVDRKKLTHKHKHTHTLRVTLNDYS